MFAMESRCWLVPCAALMWLGTPDAIALAQKDIWPHSSSIGTRQVATAFTVFRRYSYDTIFRDITLLAGR
jgi:hypothetical protein